MLNCQREVDKRYRVNTRGYIFCGEDCYEIYNEEHPDNLDDRYHPYIDDYESIRSTYIDWFENWESDLSSISTEENIQYKVDEILDKIDEVIHAYTDYYAAEGDDGVLAKDIYMYLLKFEQLQKEILQWRPQRKTLYYLSLEFDADVFEEVIEDWYDFAKFLFYIGVDDLLAMLKDHVHPYDGMAFYFESQQEKDEAVQKLQQTFQDEIISIYDDIAWRCEGECIDVEVVYSEDLEDQELWFFCDSCERSYYPGYFEAEELETEITKIDRLLEFEDPVMPSNWHFYIRKIKRSCRFHDIDFPDWIDLDYYF